MKISQKVTFNCCHCGKSVEIQLDMNLIERTEIYVSREYVNQLHDAGFVLYDGGPYGHGEIRVVCEPCYDEFRRMVDKNRSDEQDFLSRFENGFSEGE